jgi:hypothetical protein
VTAWVDRPPLYPVRRSPCCPAQRGCARGGLDDRFLRDRSRLHLHRAGVSPEAVQIADPLRLPLGCDALVSEYALGLKGSHTFYVNIFAGDEHLRNFHILAVALRPITSP